MTWHPPIPAEAVYRPEVATIGAGLRLLLYFYNCVERDGAFTFSLTQATEALEVEYETLRKWWQAIKKAEIVIVVKDMGHKGLRVQMQRDWIDWHVQSNNFSTTAQRENITVKGGFSSAQPSLNGSSTVPQRENITVDDPAYKVLISTDQAESERELEDRDGTARLLSHPAMKTLAEYFPKLTLDAKQIRSICSTATDGTVWRSVVELFAHNNWQPLIGNILDRYRKMLKEHSQSNGKITRPPADLPLVTAADNRKQVASPEERRRIIEASRTTGK